MRVVVAAASLVVAASLVAAVSYAQHVAAGRPLTVVVGSPVGDAVIERLDGRRTNASKAPLPTTSLRTIWTRQERMTLHPPLVLRDGTVIVLGDQGEADFLNADGTDQSHVQMGPGPMSAPALLTNGTLIAVNASGDVVGVRGAEVVFRTHAVEPSGGRAVDEGTGIPMHVLPAHAGRVSRMRHAAPVDRDPSSWTRAWTLPLDDGGVAIAVERDLVTLDSEGAIRSRATSPVPVASPLLAMGNEVVFVAENGDVYEWTLAASSDAVRARGSFGGPVEGVVLVEDEHHLLGVVRGSRLVSLDVPTGATETRATAGTGAFTDALALGRSTGDAGATTFVQEMTVTGTRVLMVDREGRRTPFPLMLTSQGALALPDAGGTVLAPVQTVLVTDPTGAVAYATIDGHVGVESMTTKVELGAAPCGVPVSLAGASGAQRVRVSAGFAGLVPAGPHAFVIACESGAVSLVRGEPD